MGGSEIINKIHTIGIIYLLIGWIFETQRKYLVLFIPTVQFQFLVNDNQCLVTQFEKYLLIKEGKEINNDSFVEGKLKQWNIDINPKYRKYLINGVLYCSFLMSYYLM